MVSAGKVVAMMIVTVIGVAVVVPITSSLMDETDNNTVRSILGMLPAFMVIMMFVVIVSAFFYDDDSEDDGGASGSILEMVNPKKAVDWLRENFRW